MKYFFPLLFGLVSFFLYMIIYRPAVASEDFITAIMVFFAAMASNAMINLAEEKKRWILYLYLSVSLVFPSMIPLFLKNIDAPTHMMTFGVMAAALAALKLFIGSYLKYKKEM